MKRLFYLGIAILLFMSSCTECTNDKIIPIKETNDYFKIKNREYTMFQLKYKEHQYIGIYNSQFNVSITHDPNCPCKYEY